MNIILLFLVIFISGCVSNSELNLKNELFGTQLSLNSCRNEIENRNNLITQLNTRIKELENQPKTICNKDGSMCISE
jgi:hypothetical protein